MSNIETESRQTIGGRIEVCRALALGLAVFLVMPVWAVGITGTIVGTVTDPTGAVVPQATVSVQNQETNATRTRQTSLRGDYTTPLLPPGLYQVVVEAPGFRRAIFRDIELNVDQTVRVDVELQLGLITDEVIVSGVGPLIQTDTSSLGHIVGEKKISELPLNERRFLSFALLVPGVQLPADGSSQSQEGGAISVNGAREQSNTFLLDGVDNNDQAINQWVALPPMEAIHEFKVQSSNSSAEFGRTGGAQINILLKSGTNDFHGSAFEFVRNRHFDAKNFFDPPDCTASSALGTCGDIPRFDRSQFGGSLGGPIRRDKAFFFVAYEGLRMRQADTRVSTVPSQVERAAALAAVPPAQRNPAGENVFNLYPAANVGTDLTTSNQFVATPVIRHMVDQLTLKLDYQVSGKDRISGHYALFDEDRFNPFAPTGGAFTDLPGYGSIVPNTGQNIGINWLHIASPTLLNEARVGFNRFRGGIFQENIGVNKNEELGFPTVLSAPVDLGFPLVGVAGFSGIGEPTSAPQDRHDNTFHFANTLAWTPPFNGGRHQFKFGGDIRQVQMNIFLDIIARGEWEFEGGFSGNSLIDLLRGTPDFAITVAGDTFATIETTALSFFFQDNVRLTPRFTLNLGLRYEYTTPPTERHDRLSVPDLSVNALTCTPQPNCQFITVGTMGIPRAIYDDDSNNFAPRIGFAWRPLGTNRFVIRSAYGIFYDVNHFNVNYLPRFNPPFFGVVFFPNGGTNTIQDILNQAGGILPPVPEMVASDFKDGYTQQWNLNVQYELLSDLLIDVAYVGSKATDFVGRRDLNQPDPAVGIRPFPQFASIDLLESTARSNYNSLQFRAEKRLSHGLTFLASYTWSKSIDTTSGLFSPGGVEAGHPQNSNDVRADRALSNFHTKHRFVFSGLYELPFGSGSQSRFVRAVLGNWQIGTILSLSSGRPFTIGRSVNQSGTRGGLRVADRPDQIGDPFDPGPVPNHPDPACQTTISQGGRAADFVRDPAMWFNPCAFAAPATQRFGTAGRNSVIGPDLKMIDLSLMKTMKFAGDRQGLEFRVEIFNLFNHSNFDTPDRIFDSASFGVVQSENTFGGRPPRQIQFGLRYVF